MEAGDEYTVGFQHRDCKGMTVRLVKLPEETPSKIKWWVFVRQLDFIIHGTLENKSNTLHNLEDMGCEGSIRHYTRAGDFGTSGEQHRAIIREFDAFRRSLDPLTAPAKRTSLVPLKIAQLLALNHRHRALLACLGGDIPDAWDKEDRREEDGGADEVDGRDLVPGIDSEEEELGPDALYQLAMEWGEDFDGDVEANAADLQVDEDQADALKGNYGIPRGEMSKKLSQQMQSYNEWRSAILCGSRQGKKVQDITIASDQATLLRYLGWSKAHPDMAGPLDASTFSHADAAKRLEAFSRWCVSERGMKYTSLGSYLNSMLSWISFMVAESQLDIDGGLYDTAFRLRSQAEAEGREQKMYRRRPRILAPPPPSTH
jgi:hypothetical protein